MAVGLFFYFTGDSMTLPLTHQIVKYGTIVFIVGLTSLFVFCTWAIYQMVRPLRQFTESAISIAEGNLDAPLPAIHSEDELLQLRNSFDPTQHAEVDIDAELDERAIGGLGIHLVRTIMDTVEYQRTADGYNRLVLTKKLIIEN